MRVLILDDDPYRHDAFARAHPSYDCVHVRTAQEAKEALVKERFPLVSLDYDLADFETRVTVDGSSVAWQHTGYDVVLFIINNLPPDRRPERVVVHSWNIRQATRMVDALTSNGVSAVLQPFSV